MGPLFGSGAPVSIDVLGTRMAVMNDSRRSLALLRPTARGTQQTAPVSIDLFGIDPLRVGQSRPQNEHAAARQAVCTCEGITNCGSPNMSSITVPTLARLRSQIGPAQNNLVL